MKPLAKLMTHAVAAAGLAAAAFTPAQAGQMEQMRVTVSADDLNLATPAGQRALDQRVEKAVRQVGRVTSLTTGSRILSQEVKTCLAKARAEARQQVAALVRADQRGG
ncbi:UrcA family protein [Erythrobacter cryptus]|uniref:UrcA family protein n=1 Tax=Erythrobacter cryptus TaxID=196588 RepID=UPI00041E6F6A|nr:UrcA family protein [Erythrobacter cryptus]